MKNYINEDVEFKNMEIDRKCKNCKNPYCTRTMEERQNSEVQVHLQYGWECEDKEKYLEHNAGLQIIKWHDLRKNPDDLPKVSMRVLVLLEDKLYEISSISADNRWLCTDYYTSEDKVIAWCEIPQFEEQE